MKILIFGCKCTLGYPGAPGDGGSVYMLALESVVIACVLYKLATTDGGAPVETIAAVRDNHFAIGSRHIKSLTIVPRCTPKYLAACAILIAPHSGK